MTHGGKRPNSGRKKGSKASHTIRAQTIRQLLIKKIEEEAEPLIKALIKKGKAGDVKAIQEIFNRSMGKVADSLKVDFKNPLLQVLLEISDEKRQTIKTRERADEKPEGKEMEDK